MRPTLASRITRAASAQTYFTIRYLVDRARLEDAYRAYGYFRWLDDVLDGDGSPDRGPHADALAGELAFLERQQAILEGCLRGRTPRGIDPHEAMLVELLAHRAGGQNSVETYARHMMQVMDFDVRRRGRLITGAELNEYTRWLATAVTVAMDHFIGDGTAPRDEQRYRAAAGAHVLHMLRDTYADTRFGYFNVPQELLGAHTLTPTDVHDAAYRDWVAGRVQLARDCFKAGRAYFARVPSWRHRFAGLAYIARFEWLIQTLESDDFTLRPRYDGRHALASVLVSARRSAWPLVGRRPARARSSTSQPIDARL